MQEPGSTLISLKIDDKSNPMKKLSGKFLMLTVIEANQMLKLRLEIMLSKNCHFSKMLMICSLWSIFLFGCMEEKPGKLLLNGKDLKGVSVITNNFKQGDVSGEWIATGSKAKVTYVPEVNAWNLHEFLFIDCEMENLSGQVQLAELMINGDKWSMAGVYFEPGDKKIVRAIIMRQEPTKKQLSQFPNMNGDPGGNIHLWWKSYTPDSIKSISLYLPLSNSGDRIKVGKISASEHVKTFNDEEYKALMPIMDEFGQYMHKEWPGKIKNKEGLLAADRQEIADLKANMGYTEMSKFGGWKNGPQLASTGHFRVEKYKDKWTMVDPEGYLFWSHGMDCVRPNSDTPVEGREQFFKLLPDSVGEFKDFVYTGHVTSAYTPFSAGKINLDAVKFVNFYGMNLKRKWGKDYLDNFTERTIKRLKSWEINTIANWSDSCVYSKREIPYMISVNTARSRMLIDVFDPAFQSFIENQLTAKYSGSLDDPWCIGIFVDNEISWGNETTIGAHVMSSGKYPFARRVMLDVLKKKYISISALNKVWGSPFASWDALTVNIDQFPGAKEDLKIMSGLFADEYFSRCKAAIQQVAPDKLYLGCRFDFHFYPDEDNLSRDWIIAHGGKFADIVSFNRYNYSCNTMKPVKGMDFPIILGEFHVGAMDRGLPHSGLRHSTNQYERALVYKNFLLQAAGNPYIVGVGWFQYLDQPYTGRNDGENYQIGFVTVGDYPNKEIVESARVVGRNMYQVRFGKM